MVCDHSGATLAMEKRRKREMVELDDEIFDHLAAEPFRPFRIRLKSGQVFDFRRPDNLYVGRDTFSIYRRARETPRGVDHWERIRFDLVESVTDLEIAAT
jgi:hypothetical protein